MSLILGEAPLRCSPTSVKSELWHLPKLIWEGVKVTNVACCTHLLGLAIRCNPTPSLACTYIEHFGVVAVHTCIVQ